MLHVPCAFPSPGGLLQDLLEYIQTTIDLRPLDGQGRAESDTVLTTSQNQQPFFKRSSNNLRPQSGRRLFGVAVLYKFNTDHQALTPDITDTGVFPFQPFQSFNEIFTHGCGIPDQTVLQQLDGFICRCTGNGVAAEC